MAHLQDLLGRLHNHSGKKKKKKKQEGGKRIYLCFHAKPWHSVQLFLGPL